MKSVFRHAALAVGLLPLLSCSDAQGGAPEPSLDAVRAATEKYQDVNVALAEGYVRDPLDTCEMAVHLGQPAEVGGMGIHYLRNDLLGLADQETRLDVKGTHTDFLQPAVLIYEPRADGSLELVGLENLVSAAAWEEAGNRRPPEFGGSEFQHMPEDLAHMVREHYDRHVWLYRENPSGMYAQYNPAVTCEHHVIVMPTGPDGVSHH